MKLACGACAAALLALALLLRRTWFELHLTQSFCAHEPAQLHRLQAVRVALVVVAAATALGPWLARRSTGSSIRSVLRASARWSTAGVLAFVAADLILRHVHHAPMLAPPALPPVEPDAFFGWAGVPNTTSMLLADGREVPYALDLNGYRAASKDDVIDPDQPAILVAGESIAEGVGVRYEDSFAALVARDLDLELAEAAVHGYGNDQIYWALERQLAVLRKPRAVVTFLIPQLLERDLDQSRPRLALDPHGLLVRVEAAPPPPSWWKSSPLRKLAHGLFPYHDASPIDLARAIFRKTATDAKAKGAYPLFVLANWGPACLPPEPGEPALGDRIFGGLDVPWIEVKLDPAWIESSTMHPNVKAHRVLADAIERALAEAKVAEK